MSREQAKPAAPAAILLAGGRASRLDGAPKPLLDVDGRSLLPAAVDAAAAAGCATVVVVGPHPDDAVGSVVDAPDAAGGPVVYIAALTAPHHVTVTFAQEDPPFGGPVAGVVAGLAAVPADSGWTYVLACDLARAGEAVRRLSDAIRLVPDDTEGVCLGDAGSKPQWLTAAYRTAALGRAAAAVPDRGRDAAMHRLVDDLSIAVIATDDDVVADVDTWADLARLRS